ncbi:MAG: enoyl-CoA hydratase/isomerase family protein [Chloroflexota bacterium]
MYERLTVERNGDVMNVAFNNVRLHNAMDGRMLEEMVRLCRDLDSDDAIRFVIFTGTGPSFMAGVDLKSDAMSVGNDPASARHRQRIGQELITHLRDLEQVTVAAVNGSCIGAGIAVAIACDLRVASEDSMWSLPNTSLGYFFSWACTPLLVSLVGPGNAKELILARRELNSEEAVGMNLANMSVPREQMMESVNDIVRRMRDGGPMAMRMAKKLVNASSPAHFGDVSVTEPELIERLYAAGEPVEGNAAFLEKRPPGWTQERD